MQRYSRHDAGQVEHLSGQVGQVAVDEDEQWLDNACVWGEAWGEGSQDAVDGSYQYSSQSHNKERHNAQEDIAYGHSPLVCILLKQVIENLENTQKTPSAHTHYITAFFFFFSRFRYNSNKIHMVYNTLCILIVTRDKKINSTVNNHFLTTVMIRKAFQDIQHIMRQITDITFRS